MRLTRIALSAVVLAVALAPAAASADGRCKLYPHDEQVGPLTVTTYDVVC